jgi:hypothetical protein
MLNTDLRLPLDLHLGEGISPRRHRGISRIHRISTEQDMGLRRLSSKWAIRGGRRYLRRRAILRGGVGMHMLGRVGVEGIREEGMGLLREVCL